MFANIKYNGLKTKEKKQSNNQISTKKETRNLDFLLQEEFSKLKDFNETIYKLQNSLMNLNTKTNKTK